jgi:hypothetical protein
MAITKKTTSFTLTPKNLDRLAARIGKGSRSDLLERILTEYFDILDEGLTRAQAKLTRAEASAILDVQNGTITQPVTLWLDGALAHQIHDALPDGIAGKWGFDGPALVAKLHSLSQIEHLALVDWAARFWDGDFTDLQALPKAVAGFLEG